MLRLEDGKLKLDFFTEPVEFWPYATTVCNRLIEGNYKQGDHIDLLSKELLELFREKGFKCGLDNKIAFGLKGSDGKIYYFGFKDWTFAFGTALNSDHKVAITAPKNEQDEDNELRRAYDEG